MGIGEESANHDTHPHSTTPVLMHIYTDQDEPLGRRVQIAQCTVPPHWESVVKFDSGGWKGPSAPLGNEI